MHDTTPLPGEPPKDPSAEPVRAAPPPPEADPGDEHIVLGAGIDFTDPNSPLAPFYLRASHVALAALLALVFFLLSHFYPVWHTDVWAHVRFGEEIVRSRDLPDHEPFASFADHEAPYIHYQWVSQAGAYLVFELGSALAGPDPSHQLGGGALMLSTVHAAVVVLRLLLLFLAFRRLTPSPVVAVAGVALVAVMGWLVHVPILRPQIIGELGFAAVLLALSRPLLSWRATLLWVPLVFLGWANCHGSFPMGFILLGLVLVGRALEVAWGAACPSSLVPCPLSRASDKGQGTRDKGQGVFRALWADQQLRRLALVLGLSVIATMANPHGPLLLYRSWDLSHNPNIPYMEEWKALAFGSPTHYVFLASVLLLALLLRRSPLRFTPTQVLLLLAFGLQSVAHARVVVWWIMVFVWVILPHLDAVARGRRWAWLEDTSVPSFRKTLVAALFVVVLAVGPTAAAWKAQDRLRGENRVSTPTPVRAAEELRRRYDADADRRLSRVVFAPETLGDYLLWDLRGLDPPVRVVCYSHVHLFTPEHWKKCLIVKEAARGWEEQLERWDVDFIVLDYDVYEQQEHKEQDKRPGYSNLIDRVRAAPDRWHVLSEPGQPVFLAERIRARR